MATPGVAGAAGGTSYLNFTLQSTATDGCSIHAWPALDIVDGTGTTVDQGEASATGETWVIDDEPIPFHLGWASWCDPYPVGPLTARLDLVDGGPTELALPAGFGPSLCNGSESILFVEPTANQVLEPVR